MFVPMRSVDKRNKAVKEEQNSDNEGLKSIFLNSNLKSLKHLSPYLHSPIPQNILTPSQQTSQQLLFPPLPMVHPAFLSSFQQSIPPNLPLKFYPYPSIFTSYFQIHQSHLPHSGHLHTYFFPHLYNHLNSCLPIKADFKNLPKETEKEIRETFEKFDQDNEFKKDYYIDVNSDLNTNRKIKSSNFNSHKDNETWKNDYFFLEHKEGNNIKERKDKITLNSNKRFVISHSIENISPEINQHNLPLQPREKLPQQVCQKSSLPLETLPSNPSFSPYPYSMPFDKSPFNTNLRHHYKTYTDFLLKHPTPNISTNHQYCVKQPGIKNYPEIQTNQKVGKHHRYDSNKEAYPLHCYNPNYVAPLEPYVKLEGMELWNRFHDVMTEMVITKNGRRMFPSPCMQLFNLEKDSSYSVHMDIVPVNQFRYKFQGSAWVIAGRADPEPPQEPFIHHDSPSLGSHWMSRCVSFSRLKLTNHPQTKPGYTVLNSMQKYVPRIHLIKNDDVIVKSRHDDDYDEEVDDNTNHDDDKDCSNNKNNRINYDNKNSNREGTIKHRNIINKVRRKNDNIGDMEDNKKQEEGIKNAKNDHFKNINNKKNQIKRGVTFVFNEMEFLAVTAYQNDKVTQLKIDHNPFAKGFRAISETSRRFRKRKQNEKRKKQYDIKKIMTETKYHPLSEQPKQTTIDSNEIPNNSLKATQVREKTQKVCLDENLGNISKSNNTNPCIETNSPKENEINNPKSSKIKNIQKKYHNNIQRVENNVFNGIYLNRNINNDLNCNKNKIDEERRDESAYESKIHHLSNTLTTGVDSPPDRYMVDNLIEPAVNDHVNASLENEFNYNNNFDAKLNRCNDDSSRIIKLKSIPLNLELNDVRNNLTFNAKNNNKFHGLREEADNIERTNECTKNFTHEINIKVKREAYYRFYGNHDNLKDEDDFNNRNDNNHDDEGLLCEDINHIHHTSTDAWRLIKHCHVDINNFKKIKNYKDANDDTYNSKYDDMGDRERNINCGENCLKCENVNGCEYDYKKDDDDDDDDDEAHIDIEE